MDEARQYAGDPWEKRFRAQFWADQHIHDSWNRCHLGENAPRPHGCDGTSLTPRRLRSQTGSYGRPGRYLSHSAWVRSLPATSQARASHRAGSSGYRRPGRPR